MNEDLDGAGTPEGGAAAPSPWAAPRGAAGPAYGTALPAYAAPGGRRRGRAFVGAAVGTVLALAAGAFAVTSFGDAGPASPEAAVEALFAAVEDRDVLGVLDTMAPGERAVYQPFVEDAVAELQRLRVLSDDLDLGSVAGISIDVEGLELESEALGAGVSVVRITGGTVTSSVDPRQVPLGSFVRGLMEEPDSGVALEPVTSTEELAAGDAAELVVIDDGGWHVSLHYSIAEAARKAAGAPLPDFGAGVEPEGAASPEEAVRAMVEAAVDLDARRAIALLPPGEMSALHDYAPLFLDQADQAVADLRAETSFDVSVDELDMTSEVRDGVGHVAIAGFAVSGSVDGEAFAVAYEGECLTATLDGETEELCGDELGPRGAFATELAAAQMTVLTVEEGGEWFVTPTRTLFELGLLALRALEPEDLEDPGAFFEENLGISPFLFGMAGLGEGSASTSGLTVVEGDGVDEVGADCFELYEQLPDDPTAEQWDEADAAVTACQQGERAPEPGPTGSAGPDPDEVCGPVFDALPQDATPEEVAEADKAYAACYDDVVGSA